MPRSRRGNKLSGADIERRAKLAGLRTDSPRAGDICDDPRSGTAAT